MQTRSKPNLPPEITDMVLDFVLLVDPMSLLNSSLVCRAWRSRSRRNYFSDIAVVGREYIGEVNMTRDYIGDTQEGDVSGCNPFAWDALVDIINGPSTPSASHPLFLVSRLHFGPISSSFGEETVTPEVIYRVLPYVPQLVALSFSDVPFGVWQSSYLTIGSDDQTPDQELTPLRAPMLDILTFDIVSFQDDSMQDLSKTMLRIVLLFSSIRHLRIKKSFPSDRHWSGRDGWEVFRHSFTKVSSITFGSTYLEDSHYLYQYLKVLRSQTLTTVSIRLSSGYSKEMKALSSILRDLHALEDLYFDCEVLKPLVKDGPLHDRLWPSLNLPSITSLRKLHAQIPTLAPCNQAENIFSIASSLVASLCPSKLHPSYIHALTISIGVAFHSTNDDATDVVQAFTRLSWLSILQACDKLPNLRKLNVAIVNKDGSLHLWAEEKTKKVLRVLEGSVLPLVAGGACPERVSVMVGEVEGMWD